MCAASSDPGVSAQGEASRPYRAPYGSDNMGTVRLRVPLLVLVWALALLPVLAYLPGIYNEFVWDDHLSIEHGRLIDSLANLPRLYTHDTMYNSVGEKHALTAKLNTYRPLTMSFFFIEHAIFGKRPFGFHLGSILTHAAGVLLLYAAGRRLRVTRAGALTGAALFAVHPSISEAVHWINGRSDPLCLALFLAALCVWIPAVEDGGGARLRLRLLTVALLFFAATLAKEIAFPLAVSLLALLPLLRPPWRRVPLLAAPWIAGGAAGLLCRVAALGQGGVGSGWDQVRYALLRLPLICLDGLRSIFLPAPTLQPSLFEAYYNVSAAHSLGAAAALLFLCGLCGLALYRGRALPAWALGAFLLTMAPIAMLTYNEGWSGWGRYLYHGAALSCLALGAALWDDLLPRVPRVPWARALAALCAVVVIIMAVETGLAAQSWRGDRALAGAYIADQPTISVGYSVLGEHELNAGHLPEALGLLQQAIERAPRPNYQHYARMAWVLMKLGRAEEAYAAARMALRLEPEEPTARYIHALERFNRGDQGGAARMLMALYCEDPKFEGAWLSIQNTLAKLGPGSAFAAGLRLEAARPGCARVRAQLQELPLAPRP